MYSTVLYRYNLIFLLLYLILLLRYVGKPIFSRTTRGGGTHTRKVDPHGDGLGAVTGKHMLAKHTVSMPRAGTVPDIMQNDGMIDDSIMIDDSRIVQYSMISVPSGHFMIPDTGPPNIYARIVVKKNTRESSCSPPSSIFFLFLPCTVYV